LLCRIIIDLILLVGWMLSLYESKTMSKHFNDILLMTELNWYRVAEMGM